MATDTACQRYLYYHTAEDTPDKVNFPRLAEATGSLYRCCAAMAEEGLDDHRCGVVATAALSVADQAGKAIVEHVAVTRRQKLPYC